VVLAAGFTLPCARVPGQVLTALPGAYELSALGHSAGCGPSETTLYRLRVSHSGDITILDAVGVEPAELRCDGGQPELVLAAPPLA
jgi:hypothetical protein